MRTATTVLTRSIVLALGLALGPSRTLAAAPPAPSATAPWVRVQFREVDTLFANPGQGWMSQQRSPKGEPRLSLLDARGQPVFTADAKADPRTWLPGEYDVAESFVLPPSLPSGEYAVAVALVAPEGQHRAFRLAIDAPERDGRYVLSHLRVK